MLSIARSKLALPAQLCFLSVHSIGLLLGVVYNHNTPELYENNSHNRIGWIVTWVVVGQCVIGVIKLATGYSKPQDIHNKEEGAALLPMSTEAIAQHGQTRDMSSPDPYRYSNDSGHFTASRSQSVSSTQDPSEEEEHRQKLHQYEACHEEGGIEVIDKRGFLANRQVERIAQGTSALISERAMKALDSVHNAVDRLILLPGFITFISGVAVYGGAFVGLHHTLFHIINVG